MVAAPEVLAGPIFLEVVALPAAVLPDPGLSDPAAARFPASVVGLT